MGTRPCRLLRHLRGPAVRAALSRNACQLANRLVARSDRESRNLQELVAGWVRIPQSFDALPDDVANVVE